MVQRHVTFFLKRCLQVTVPVPAVFDDYNTTSSNASYYYKVKGVHSNLFYFLNLDIYSGEKDRIEFKDLNDVEFFCAAPKSHCIKINCQKLAESNRFQLPAPR